MENLIKNCLSRLFLFQCKDSSEFLISLKSLPQLLSENQMNFSFKILMIDSISSFFWLDKNEEEMGKIRQKRFIKQISQLINDFNLVMFATKQLLFPKDVPNSVTMMTSPSTTGVLVNPYQESGNYLKFYFSVIFDNNRKITEKFTFNFIFFEYFRFL